MRNPSTPESARISEIFSSLQGEGPRSGERHLFIRFEECHIHCQYCDELDKIGTETSLEEVLEQAERLEREEGPHTFVSLTGGEPLLYLPFLKSLMPALKSCGFRTYLETNGILWQALREVIGWCDLIAMDMKPASVTKESNYDEGHRQFLSVARDKECFIKIILSKEIDLREYEAQIRMASEIAPEVPIILQPISGEIEGHEDPKLMNLIEELQRLGMKWHRNIRMMPRLHRILKIR